MWSISDTIQDLTITKYQIPYISRLYEPSKYIRILTIQGKHQTINFKEKQQD